MKRRMITALESRMIYKLRWEGVSIRKLAKAFKCSESTIIHHSNIHLFTTPTGFNGFGHKSEPYYLNEGEMTIGEYKAEDLKGEEAKIYASL